MVKVINLFSGPGAGKSTTAAGVFSLLKLHGVSIELSTEYAKDVTHKEAFKILKDQLYVLGKQQHKTFIVKDKYKYVITDSPILLSAVYADQTDKELIRFVVDRFLMQDNINFFINRLKPYVTVGRSQNEEQAKQLDREILDILDKPYIGCSYVNGDYTGINTIAEQILKLEGKEMICRLSVN